MRTLCLAIVMLAAAATPALAYCPSVPDDASTGYTANQAALALCRQQELSDAVRRQQQQSNLDGQLRQLELQMRINEQFSRAQQALPQLP